MSRERQLQDAVARADWPRAADLAEGLFERSGARDPRWAYAAALAAERQGDAATARDWMVRASEVGGDFAPAWDGRARLSLAAGDHRGALAALDHALSLRPATPADRLLLGQLQLATGATTEALASFAEAADRDPASRPAITKALAGQPRGILPWSLARALPIPQSSAEAAPTR